MSTGKIMRFVAMGLGIFSFICFAMPFLEAFGTGMSGFELLEQVMDSFSRINDEMFCFLLAFAFTLDSIVVLILAATCVKWRLINLFSAIFSGLGFILMIAAFAEDSDYLAAGYYFFIIASIGVVVCSILAMVMGRNTTSYNNYNSTPLNSTGSDYNSGNGSFL